MSINQKNGPRTGNTGSPAKRSAFIAAKESYAATARAITEAIGSRAGNPKSMPVSKEKNQGRVQGDVNKGRGPTRGNK